LLLNPAVGVAGLATLLCSMSACIIPVAPNFQDPVSSPEAAPWIHDPSPYDFGQTISVSAGRPANITARVTDLNGSDLLYQKWLVNPPFSGQTLPTTTLKNEPIQSSLGEAQILIECIGDTWMTNPMPQLLQLIVADGPFTGPGDAVDPPTERSYADWILVLQCSSGGAGSTP